MPTSERLVAIAAHGLAGSRTDLPATRLTDIEWFDLVQGCVAADLVGFLAAAVAEGHLHVSDGQADELAVLETEHTGVSLLVERRALTMAALLTAAGIEYRIIDGPARRLAYGDVALRQSRTVQVLVPPDRLDDALALQGPPPSTVGGRPVQRRERLALRSSLAALGQDDAHGVDSGGHDAGEASAVDHDLVDRLGPAATIELAGRAVSVLTLEQQLVLACVEATTAPIASLVQARDVAQISLAAALDSTRARRLAEATRVAGALAEGISLAWSSFDLADKTDLSVWARRMGGSRRDRPGAQHTSLPAGRVGLAQRVFGRRPSVPLSTPTSAALASSVTSTSTRHLPPNGSGRSHRSPRS